MTRTQSSKNLSRVLFVTGAVTWLTVSYLVFSIFPLASQELHSGAALLILSSFLAANLTALFYASFVHTMRNVAIPAWLSRDSLLASLGVSQALLPLLAASETLSLTEAFVTWSVFQGWSLYLLFQIGLEERNVPTKQKNIFAYAMILVSFGFTAVMFPLRNWYPITELFIYGLLWQAISVITGSLYILFVFDKFDSATNVSGKTPGSKKHYQTFLHPSFQLFLTPAYIAVMMWLIALTLSKSPSLQFPSWILVGCSGAFIPSLIKSSQSLQNQSETNRHIELSSRLAGPSALKLLKRVLNSSQGDAGTSLGLRTAVFTIDHDPSALISTSLPASISHIRGETIHRVVSDVLGARLLHLHHYGQIISAALDAEQTARPCVDTINLFACLYLDAGLIVERRLNGLSRVLPIVNPGLANAIKSEVLQDLVKRTQWFFHFDYQWVDQNLISNQQGARYGVQMNPVTNEQRARMITHHQRSSALGSFLWMGSEAHQRLIQEAPMLTSAAEAIDLPSTDGKENVVFTLKFETLIPKLQRYFDLDMVRMSLMDYDVRPEALKLIHIFTAQSQQARTPEAMMNLVESVASYPWHGFKEKDHALRIIIAANQFANTAIEANERSGYGVPRTIMKLRSMIYTSVEGIGYPAQFLHRAHRQKIAERQLQHLLSIVADPENVRAGEGWVLLSTLDLRKQNEIERKQLLALFQSQAMLYRVMANRSIQARVIETFINLALSDRNVKEFFAQQQGTIQNILNCLIAHLPHAETLSILIDGLAGLSIALEQDAAVILLQHQELNRYVQYLSENGGPSVTPLLNRWSELQRRPQNYARQDIA